MLSLVALLGLGGDLSRGVYLLIFSAVIGVAACVIGITAVRKARRTGSYRPRAAVGGIIIGALAALLSIPILATYLAFPRQVNNYVKCLNQAQTSGSQQACMDKFYRSIHLGSPTLGSAPADPDPAGSGQRRGPA
jgi:amino acid transporter